MKINGMRIIWYLWYCIKPFFIVSNIKTTRNRKVWTVTFLDWNCFWFKSYWFRYNAIKCFKKHKDIWLFVYLKNEVTNEKLYLKDNPQNIAPIKYVEE